MIKRQLLCRASVKREMRMRPTKNGVANLAPLRFSFLGVARESLPKPLRA